MPRQASRRHFILLCSSSFSRFTVCTIFQPTEANFLVLTAPEGRILKENYHKFSLGAYPITQFTHPPKHMAFACARDSSTPLLGPRPSYSHRSYGAPLVPQQEQTPGAATNPVGSAQELGTIYALFAANLNSLHSRRNHISLQSHSFKTFVTHLPPPPPTPARHFCFIPAQNSHSSPTPILPY